MNPHNMTRRRPTRDRYTVIVVNPDPASPGEVEHTVEITPADQLRAEILGHQHGLGPMREAPLNYTVLWIYASLTRRGLYGEDWHTFVNRDLYAYDAADPDPGGDDQDPTVGSVQLEGG